MKPVSNFRLSLCAGAAISVAAMMTPAMASAQQMLEEITVTAQRVEENLQSVPIAVTALTAAALQDRSASSVGDIAQYTPNMARVGGPTGGADGYYYIRGVGQSDFTAAQDPGVATYLDGVYLGRTAGSNFDLLDIERIEVLRGPQGTLFGRNAVGGAVSVTTTTPKGEFGGKVVGTVGSRNHVKIAGMVEFPVIADKLAASVSGQYRRQDGFGKSGYDSRTYGDIDNRAARIKLNFTPTENLSFLLAIDASKYDNTSDPVINLGATEGPQRSPIGVSLPNDFFLGAGKGLNADRSSDFYTSFSSVDPVYKLDTWGVSLTSSWNLGAVSLKSITAYRALDERTTADFDASRFVFYDQFQTTEQNQFSQELQMTGKTFNERLSFLLGAFYYDENVKQNNAICQGGGPLRNVDQCVRNNQRISPDVKSIAGFANGTFKVTERFHVTGGLRYTWEKKEQGFDFAWENPFAIARLGLVMPPGGGAPILVAPYPTRFGVPAADLARSTPPFSFFPSPPFVVATIPLPSGPNAGLNNVQIDRSWRSWTGRLAAEYQLDHTLLYASYSRGFKSGGINPRPISPVGLTPFEPETLDTIEVGSKSDLFDRRLRLNLSAYYSKYKAIQTIVSDPVLFIITANAGDMNLYGGELELTALPFEGLEASVSVGYTSNEWDSLTAVARANGIDYSDVRNATPEWTANVGVQYTFPKTSVGEFAVRADVHYQSEIYFDPANFANGYQDGYSITNLRASWVAPNEQIRVALYGTNVFEEEYLKMAQDVRNSFGTSFGWPGNPAEYGLELSYKF